MMPFQLDPIVRSQIALVLSVLSSILGLAVGYLALKGYWQSRKRPMFFIAIGFFLVFWTPLLLLAGPVLAPVVGQFIFGVLGEISRIIGLLCILYGLKGPFKERS